MARKSPAPAPCYLGLDPGKSGAYAVISGSREVLMLEDLPLVDDRIDYLAMCAALAPYHLTAAALEQPIPYAVNAYSAMSLGATWGLCLAAVLQVAPDRLLLPTASSWKRHSGLTADKALSVATAREKFEGLPKRLRHDKAEALLLADYALRISTPA